jgi:hypothetical protein
MNYSAGIPDLVRYVVKCHIHDHDGRWSSYANFFKIESTLHQDVAGHVGHWN